MAITSRRFPPPWTIIEHAESFWVQDASGRYLHHGWRPLGCGRRSKRQFPETSMGGMESPDLFAGTGARFCWLDGIG
jgi:hypothetical protein